MSDYEAFHYQRADQLERPIPRTRADVPKPLDWAAGAIPAPMSSSEAASDLGMMDVSLLDLTRGR